MNDLNPDEMHQIKEIRMTAWCFIDHKPLLELICWKNIFLVEMWVEGLEGSSSGSDRVDEAPNVTH